MFRRTGQGCCTPVSRGTDEKHLVCELVHTNLITIDTSARDTAWATSVVKGKTYIVGAALVPTANTSPRRTALVIVMIKMEGKHGTKDIRNVYAPLTSLPRRPRYHSLWA